MNKKFLFKQCILISVFMLAGIVAFSQRFSKGNHHIDIGLGLGFYETRGEDDTFHFVSEDDAASLSIPITYEYAVGNRIGIGAIAGLHSYLRDEEDSTTNAGAVEAGLFFNFHFIKSETVDLFAGIKLSGSSIRIDNSNDAEFSAGGSSGDIHLGARFGIGNNVHLIASMAAVTYNFPDGTLDLGSGLSVGYEYKLSGFFIGTGIGFRF